MKIEPLDHFEKILLLKRYSKQTIDNYVSHLRLAQVFFENKNFTSISDKEWFNYLFHLVHTKKNSCFYSKASCGELEIVLQRGFWSRQGL